MNDADIKFATVDSLAHLLEPQDAPIILLSRREIEAGLIGDALARLMVFSDTPENIRQFEGTMRLVVSGYDDDPRELHQIPEVVRFVRTLTDQWPYWFHFMARDEMGLPIPMMLLVDLEVSHTREGQVFVHVNDEDIRALMFRLFDGMNHIQQFAGMTGHETIRSTDAVMEAVNLFMS